MAATMALCNIDRDCPSDYICQRNVCTHSSKIANIQVQQLVDQRRVTICPFCQGETDGFGQPCVEGKHPSCPSVHTLSTKGGSDGSQDVGVNREGTLKELPSNLQELKATPVKTLVANAGSYLNDFLEKVLGIDDRVRENQYFVASQSKIGKALQKK